VHGPREYNRFFNFNSFTGPNGGMETRTYTGSSNGTSTFLIKGPSGETVTQTVTPVVVFDPSSNTYSISYTYVTFGSNGETIAYTIDPQQTTKSITTPSGAEYYNTFESVDVPGGTGNVITLYGPNGEIGSRTFNQPSANSWSKTYEDPDGNQIFSTAYGNYSLTATDFAGNQFVYGTYDLNTGVWTYYTPAGYEITSQTIYGNDGESTQLINW